VQPALYNQFSFPFEEKMLKGSLRGAKPLFRKNLPLPLIKGKGIKGIGFLDKKLKGVD